MANTTVYTNNQYYQDIAAAIRNKNGQSTLYKPSEMAPAINALVVSGQSINLQVKTVNPTTTQQNVTPDNGYNGLSSVTVNAIQTQSKTVTANGTVTPDSGKYLTSVVVNVPVGSTINNQNKTITPNESQQIITADSGYTGLGTVTVGAISSTYVGSGVTRNPNRTVNGCTVTIPGPAYYTGNVSTNVAEGSTGTPIATKGTVSNNSISITPSVTNTTGYITGGAKTGTAITVSANELVSGNKVITANGTNIDVTNYATVSVDVASSGTTINNQNKTVDPIESRQYISADSGYTGLGQVIVEPISSTYIGSDIITRSIADLTVSGATVSVPAGYYSSATSKSVATATQATPSISINSTGLITASATQIAGYVSAGTKSATQQLTTKAATTITPTNASQTAVAKNVYTLGAITVAAVPEETGSFTSNGTFTPSEGKWFSSVEINVPIGSTINNQNKSVTPTKSQQSISADSGYTGLGTVTVNAIPAAYITTSDADAVAANILLNKTAYVNGSKITGSMANNGATGGTITVQGGTYTIPAGYTSGGTVTANIAASTVTNTIINGAAELEDTNDYAFKVEVNIPAGYHNATTLTKSFSSILPAPDTAVAENQMLAGYQAYDKDGKLLTGSMINNAA